MAILLGVSTICMNNVNYGVIKSESSGTENECVEIFLILLFRLKYELGTL